MTPEPRSTDDPSARPERVRAAQCLAECLAGARRVVAAGHLPLDGDGLGSALGLVHVLRAAGIEAAAVLGAEPPGYLRFLPGLDDAVPPGTELPFTPDVFVALDGGAANRFGGMLAALPRSTVVLNLDHHVSNTRFGHVNWVDGSYAATGLMIYDLVRDLTWPLPFDAAVCLYTTLVTDTGRFSYSNTCPRTHLAAADLIARGVRPEQVLHHVYRCKTRGQLDLFAATITNLETAAGGRLAWTHVSLEMCRAHGVSPQETGDLIEIATSLSGVEVSVLFREQEHGTRVSVRTTTTVDASALAQRFGGGGHPRAAGFPLAMGHEQARAHVIPVVLAALGSGRIAGTPVRSDAVT